MLDKVVTLYILHKINVQISNSVDLEEQEVLGGSTVLGWWWLLGSSVSFDVICCCSDKEM